MPKRRRKSTRQPCARCGGQKLEGQGQRYCADCRENARWTQRRKRSTRAVVRRKPCVDCGGIKEPGHGRRRCKACAQKRRGIRHCLHCPAVVKPPKRLCPACKAIQIENRRLYDIARHKRYRAARPKPIRVHKPLTQAQSEDRRINYRGRKGETGGRRTLSEARYLEIYGTGYGNAPRVSSAPLMDALLHLVDEYGEKMAAEIVRMSPRRLSDVVDGTSKTISVRTADRICVGLGLPMSLVYGDAA